MLCVVVWGVCGGCVRFCRQQRACCRGEVRALNDAPLLPSRDKTARLVRAAFGKAKPKVLRCRSPHSYVAGLLKRTQPLISDWQIANENGDGERE